MSEQIKTWQERVSKRVRQFIGNAMSQIPYMEAEIADLRARIAELEAALSRMNGESK